MCIISELDATLCQTKAVDGKEKPPCVTAEFPKMEIWQLGWKEQTERNDVMIFHEFTVFLGPTVTSMKAAPVTVQTKRPHFRKQKNHRPKWRDRKQQRVFESERGKEKKKKNRRERLFS